MVSGLILTKTGRYRPLHLAGYALMTLGAGLFTLLDKNASLAVYVIVQIVAGLGSGLALTTLLPATQAALSERDTASSTVTWTFVRSSGTVWGVAVPSAIFNTRASAAAGTAAAGRIEDAAARAMMADGLVWIVAAVIAGFSFFVVFVEKEIKLRDDLETEFGLKGGEVDGGREEEGGKGSEKGIVG
ncbi:putative major facilitator superfamily protein [Eutypa lata UCREL1]|uniref:Putative major facilitator superfamily protein n=1 Tax=Eutypa lata (strain UCR-EL1) TaxID=1287681 RepID=M7SQF7_EUTLA|nr:putative major facilitator superfamily protein [Eutypa lata UCREL1]